MELLRHVGVYPYEPSKDHQLTRGVLLMAFLVVYLVVYHLLAVSAALVKVVFPQMVMDYKQSIITGFCKLCLYVLELNKVEVEVTGDEMEPECSIIISNHSSLVDYMWFSYLAQRTTFADEDKIQQSEVKALGSSPLVLPRVFFFTWFLLWQIPTVKVVKNIASCDENWDLDANSQVRIFRPLKHTKSKDWVVLFPEVNIWSRSNLDLQNMRSEKYYLPKLRNVLYPRYPGVSNTLEALKGTGFSRFYDVTILYTRKNDTALVEGLEGRFKPPTLLDIFCEPANFKVRIHVKAKITTRLPVKRRRLEKWLETLWFEKDAQIEQMKSET